MARHVRGGGRNGLVPALAAAALTIAGSLALAQTPASPGSGGDIERRVPAPTGPRLAPAPSEPVPSEPAPSEPVTPPQSIAPFVLLGVEVVGARTLDAATLLETYETRLATTVGPADLAAIAEAISARYRAAGYALATAFVPPQRVVGGIAVIRVIEGRIERIEIESTEEAEPAASLARAIAAPILREAIARRATVERALLLIGDLPGIEIGRARLRPIDIGAGTYALVVPLRIRRVEAGVTLDNRGSRDYGPLQLWTSGQLNLPTADAAWAAQAGVFTAPASPREILYGQAALSRSLGHDGLQLRAQVSGSRNVAGGPLADVDARTQSARFTVNLTYPFLRARRLSLWGGAGIEALRIAEDRAHRRFFVDELRVLRLGLTATHAAEDGTASWLVLQTSLGLDALGASDTGPLRSRPRADSQFVKLRADAVHVQPLHGPWSVELRAGGQIADDTLFSAEEFDLGGSRYGRAFEPGALAGDRGMAAGLELRHADAVRLPRIARTELFAFADGGVVWLTTDGGRARDHLASGGVGVRARFDATWRASLEVGHPLASSVRKLRDQGPRLYFSIGAEF